jgi:NADPH-dependent curcumin reductase CurA
LKGLKVIAIAGSDDKCAWLENEIGVDKALNYKSPTFAKDLEKIGYLDVMFDNVAGDILDLCLKRLNKGARIVLCGELSVFIVSTQLLLRITGGISQYSKLLD